MKSMTTAKYPSKCQRCGLKIRTGDEIARVRIDGWVHEDCEWASWTRQIDERVAEGWTQARIIDWIWASPVKTVEAGLLRNTALEYTSERMAA